MVHALVPMRIDSAQTMTVIRIEAVEGKGVQDDPIRQVIYLCDPETGTVLARLDSWPGDNTA